MTSFNTWGRTRDRMLEEAFDAYYDKLYLQVFPPFKIKTNMLSTVTSNPYKNTQVNSAYADEKVKLDTKVKDEMQIWMQIYSVLEDYGYSLDPVLVDGKPEIKLIKD